MSNVNYQFTPSRKIVSSQFFYRGGWKWTFFFDDEGEVVAVIKEQTRRPEHVRKLLINF